MSMHVLTGLAQPAVTVLDHLVYAVPDLELAIDKLENELSVRATPGGTHPGLGTRNALIGLGREAYLEILAPDPGQSDSESGHWFGIDQISRPRLVGWAVKSRDLYRLTAQAAERGIRLGAVSRGSRKRADGQVLAWQFTPPDSRLADGIVPFFIDWESTPHPAASAAPGLSLVAVRAEHPDPDHVQPMLCALGLDLPLTLGPTPALIASLRGERGLFELR